MSFRCSDLGDKEKVRANENAAVKLNHFLVVENLKNPLARRLLDGNKRL
jgi:hypothetical protein